jgi:toxin HigB-1
MIIGFKHKGLGNYFATGNKSGIQPQHEKKLRLILGRLHASTEPKDMNLPGLRLHQLSGILNNYFAVDVSGNWRVIFRFKGQDAVDVDYLDYH